MVVLAACSQLQSRATQFVLESFGSQAFGKALDCIKAMRSAAIKVRTSNHFKFFSFSTECAVVLKASKPDIYNKFAREMKESVLSKGKADFFDEMISGWFMEGESCARTK